MPQANFGSYPPESCHGRNAARNVDRDDTIQHKMQDFDPVTVLDLQCLDLDKLGEICKDWGLFRLVNLAKKLLSLSFESQQALLASPISCFQSTFSSVSCSDQMLDTFRPKKISMSEILNLKSYPPVFRQQYIGIQQNSGLDDTTKQIQEVVNDDAIPVLDFQCLDLGKLQEACEDWGLFRLVNHGIPLTLMSQLRDHSRNLFSLTFESKQELFTNPMSYFWGTTALTPTGAALSIGPQNINWVEGLNIPLSQLSLFQKENETLGSFRVLLEEYGGHLARLATTMFGAMAKSLHLDPELSKTYISESTGFVRVYRYPQCSMENEAWGINVHTDSSVLSILNQDQVGGLQVLKDDNWLQVKPIPDTLVFNLGDMMQAISDDKYKSVKHRVKVNKEKERFSICYFVFPAEGSVIQSSKYRPFTYSDFQAQVQQDVKTLGFKVGLERFKFKVAG